MEIEIKSDGLVDSPYNMVEDSIFAFDDYQVQNFANDIKYGLSTCYLVSGYRGVGKTSLIKRVEQQIRKDLDPKEERGSTKTEKTEEKSKSQEKPLPKDIIFVYVNLAKYDKRTHLIRKLIRELYLAVETSAKYRELDEKFRYGFELLYKRTFNEVSETSEEKKTQTTKWSFKLNPLKAIGKIAKLCAPVILTIPWYAYVILQRDFSWLFNYVIPVILFIWTVFNLIKLKFSFETENKALQSLSVKTLFDDEIADTLLFGVLKELKKEKFKIVFVLDELDKVEGDDLELLISELKPYLVCGHANFIAVGGQDFFYKFENDEAIDDSILSSIFSKIYHVPLSSAATLRDIFLKKLVDEKELSKFDKDQKAELDVLLDYMIFNSRLIPRRFITRLRQVVIWKGDKAYLVSDGLPEYAPKCKQVIKMIDDLDDKKVSAENVDAIRDFIIMKMYMKMQYVFSMKTKFLDKNDFVHEWD